MNCSFCGAELENGSSFCGVCGSCISELEPSANFGPKPKKSGFSLGIISMILGILAWILFFPCSCCAYTSIFTSSLSTISAISSLIIAIIGIKKASSAGWKNKLAIVGLILSIALFVLMIVVTILAVVLVVLGMFSGSALEILAASGIL